MRIEPWRRDQRERWPTGQRHNRHEGWLAGGDGLNEGLTAKFIDMVSLHQVLNILIILIGGVWFRNENRIVY
jgi:hypothetical protein